MPGMLIQPDKITVYVGRTHIAVEYFGPTTFRGKLDDTDGFPVHFIDCREDSDLVETIVDMRFAGTGPKLPLAPLDLFHNLFLPVSAEASELMMDSSWDMTAEDMAFSINCGGVQLPQNDFGRMINCFFYSAEEGRLRTRRIQWIEFFPCKVVEETEEEELIDVTLWPDCDYTARHDSQLQFPVPATFENERLSLLNRFRELILAPNVSEPQITSWLAEPAHQFILRMAIPAVHLLHQKVCPWVDMPARPALIPDFLIEKANGYGDILEFKLPHLKSSAVVGITHRETFSAEIASYIAQSRTYREYFNESRNCDYVENTFGITIDHPKRYLVLGRRWDFENAAWRAIQAEYPDLTLLTYDDLLDSVSAQLYQNPKQ
jgi:hypothetical protein